MNTRASAWLAWSLAGLSFVMFLAGFVLFLLARATLAPGGWGADLSVGGMLVFLPFLAILCMLASALSLVLRFRRTGGEEREQIKWIAFSASVVIVVTVITVVVTLRSSAEAWFAPNTPEWLILLQYAAQMSLAAVPIAVGFAVLKYRLYDIDLLINRALVYGALTATLALVYFGGVVVLQGVFRTLTGQESTIAIVASTLAIAALFVPLRRRVQAFVDRRFYRRKYDAAKTLASFSVRLRQETDLGTLSDNLVRVVSETLQPAYVSLWLRPDAESEDRSAAIIERVRPDDVE